MISHRYSRNIKTGLLLLGIILITGIVIYSQWIVEKLREDNRNIVQMYSEIIAEAVESESDENLNFIFDKIISRIQFPIIQSDINKDPQSWKNLPFEESDLSRIKRNQELMDQQNAPIELFFSDPLTGKKQLLGYLHFGDSNLIHQLLWLPYLEIGVISFFICLGIMGFTYIRKTENNNIWTGMAKETAHQLGTPVSALIGWIQRIKSHPDKIRDIVPEIEADVNRLEQVGNRFGKIGSSPKLNSINVLELIKGVINYLNRRLPSDKLKIEIEHKISPEIKIEANETLLSWAIENVIKNGLDSMKSNEGTVYVKISSNIKGIRILIEDDGKGILRRNWKKVFQPGFTTKKHGWGFGLSLSYRIIKEIHHGTIQILKSSPDTGTTVEIHIP
ncbi:MAG: HAMP domain-containing sensor histidine kinase [Candidatus Marinimicrobia bacterium]|jgi:anti-sigma regulatory factor (Ser/Thr protein kinase)|nr:HAMP domain-containing sensor histidine kinase [Candidatus Neomarinimicrobiota bacterium]|tara:strand:+ start:424 stop:1593 length:1170 start_codon:yes stop_codon:yes gene_type:complete